MVTDRIREEIVAGEHQLGDALSEARLSEALGVSRTPVREALLRLETEGLVTIAPQRGTFVFTLNAKQLRDICDLRVCLESTALRLSVQRQASLLADALQKICEAMTGCRQREDTPAYLKLDTDFHQTFFDYCDNEYLADAYQTIAARMAALRNRLGDDPAHMAKSFAEHKAITQAVRNNDLEESLSILERHIGRKEGSYWSVPSELPPSDSIRRTGLRVRK